MDPHDVKTGDNSTNLKYVDSNVCREEGVSPVRIILASRTFSPQVVTRVGESPAIRASGPTTSDSFDLSDKLLDGQSIHGHVGLDVTHLWRLLDGRV